MKYFILFLLALTVVLPALGQDSTARPLKNTVFLEYGGAGIRYSLNYERRLLSLWHNCIGIEAAIGYCSWKGDTAYQFTDARSTVLPFRLQASYTQGRHTVFVGAFSLARFYPMCSLNHHTGQWECQQDINLFDKTMVNPYIGYISSVHKNINILFTIIPIYYTINRNASRTFYEYLGQKYIQPTINTPFDKSGFNPIVYPDVYRRKVIPWLGASVGYRF